MKIEPKDIEKYFEKHDSESDIREYKHLLTKEDAWGTPSCCVTLSESFIREFADKLNWSAVSCHQELSSKFIIEFADKIEWEEFERFGVLTREILERCGDYLHWERVIFYNKVDEDLLEANWYKFNKTDYEKILKYQNLSEKFLKKHRNMWWNTYENINLIFQYQKENISREFRRKLLLRHRVLLYKFLNMKYNKK